MLQKGKGEGNLKICCKNALTMNFFSLKSLTGRVGGGGEMECGDFGCESHEEGLPTGN